MERIFCAMVTNNDHRVRLTTHILAEEAKYWCASAKRRLEAGGEVVSWERFKIEFLSKYFPEDLRNKKEVEFMQPKQESLSFAKYVAMFEVVPI